MAATEALRPAERRAVARGRTGRSKPTLAPGTTHRDALKPLENRGLQWIHEHRIRPVRHGRPCPQPEIRRGGLTRLARRGVTAYAAGRGDPADSARRADPCVTGARHRHRRLDARGPAAGYHRSGVPRGAPGGGLPAPRGGGASRRRHRRVVGPHPGRDLPAPRADSRLRRAGGVGGVPVMCALAELAHRAQAGRRPREGAGGARIGRPAAVERRHAARADLLFEGARPDARGDPGQRTPSARLRAVRPGILRRTVGARVAPGRPGHRGDR